LDKYTGINNKASTGLTAFIIKRFDLQGPRLDEGAFDISEIVRV